MGPVTVLICLFHVFPFYILLTSSLKMESDLSSKWIMPGYVYLENFKNAWERAGLANAFVNNVIITLLSVALLIVIGSLSSYPLARFPTKWNRFMYTLFVSVLIVPPLSILVPLYRFYVNLGAVNTYWGIVLLHVTFYLPITIFLYTGFIRTIPRELDEAALIDGSGRLRMFFNLILPLLQPVTATVAIICGVQIWNDYQFSIFFLQDRGMHTFTVALSGFIGQYVSNIPWVAAGSLLSTLPIVALYLFLQKHFIHGLASGAVKG